MQPEERDVCAEESLPKERKSRERISFLSLDKCCINECTYAIILIAPPGGAEWRDKGEGAIIGRGGVHVGVVWCSMHA